MLEVPERSGIRIHKGSYAGATDAGFRSDFLGCISFGRAFLWDRNLSQHLLHTTAVTIAKLEKYLNYQDFYLEISGEFPPIQI